MNLVLHQIRTGADRAEWERLDGAAPYVKTYGADDFVAISSKEGRRAYVDGHEVLGMQVLKPGSLIRVYEPGDRVVLYSDGVLEAQDEQGDAFGFERTADCVRQAGDRGLTASGLLDELMYGVRTFAGEAPRTDDQTAVVLHVLG